MLIDNKNISGTNFANTPIDSTNLTLNTLDNLLITNKTRSSLDKNLTINNTTFDVNAGTVFNVNNVLTFTNNLTTTTLNGTLNFKYSPIGSLANVSIQSTGILTHNQNTTSKVSFLDISATNLTVDTGGKIDASNVGYTGGVNSSGNGPGGGQFQNGSSNGGAGYGGRGGSGSTFGGISYGSITQPTDLGSGGADTSNWGARGGNGGGAIKLSVSGTTTVNGSILANGETISDTYVGGGSGGSIWIDTNTLTGSGTIAANGGNSPGAGNPAGGGGGGRIAIYYQNRSGTMTQGTATSSITVNGGTGNGDCSEPTVTETFTDTNGNGYYDLGEPFVDVVASGNTAGRRDEKAAYTNNTSGCTGTIYDGNSPEPGLASLLSSNLSPNPNPISVGSDFAFSVTGIKNSFGFDLFSGTCSVDIIRTSGAVNYASTVSSVSGTVSNGVCNLVGPASGGKFPDPGSFGELSVKVTVNRILEPPITEFKDFLSLSVYSAASNKAKADGTNTTEPVSGYDLSSTPVPSLLGSESNLHCVNEKSLVFESNNLGNFDSLSNASLFFTSQPESIEL